MATKEQIKGQAWALRTHREFWTQLAERYAPEPSEPAAEGAGSGPELSRRGFMSLLGASMALAGVEGCTSDTVDEALPYVDQPPEVTPTIPLHYATSMELDGFATGLVVEAHEGRPTKIEGNPQHPASLGASGVFEQASLLQLYDPYRGKSIKKNRQPSSWDQFLEFTARLERRVPGGRGLHLLLRPTSSPLVEGLLERLQKRLPQLQLHVWTPLQTDHALDASKALFGEALIAQYDFRKAKRVLAVDSDFTATGPFHLRYARQFSEGRRIAQPTDAMNRLYVVESTVSPTGTAADHRLAAQNHEQPGLLAAVLKYVFDARGTSLPRRLREALERVAATTQHAAWANKVAEDLLAHPRESLVVVGERQPRIAHALAAALNHELGNVGNTLWYTDPPPLARPDVARGLTALTSALNRGDVSTLVILGTNPVYDAYADLDFPTALTNAETTVYVGLYENETARQCDWYIPESHYLEAWGDARARDGTISFVQPLIKPLFASRSTARVLASMLDEGRQSDRELLFREHGVDPENLSEEMARWVQQGFIPNTELPERPVRPGSDALATLLQAYKQPPQEGFEISFRTSPQVYDGRFANNPWLMELPEPVTKLTWDNAATVGPQTAARFNLESSQVVTLTYRGRSLDAPVLIVEGQAEGTIEIALGYGREGSEVIARDVGVNAYTLRQTAAPSYDWGLQLTPRNVEHALAVTQDHWNLHGRPIALASTLAAYRETPELAGRFGEPQPSLRAQWPQPSPQWGMAIDLNACTGCNACVIACQAENNVPVVGKLNVRKGREMHWLRIDRYITQSSPQRVVMQPMLCQHCERAPCEYVCPVNATSHSPDGINEMTYNRCVGTRFCSNNCPYKVRRFNWFNLHRDASPLVQMAMNPDVTVRQRGVMEKCTYCVQRIRGGSGTRGTFPGTDRVQTACEQACPTRAIVFGDITNNDSEVSQRYASGRTYKVLNELGTEPRTRYMIRIRNLNEELEV